MKIETIRVNSNNKDEAYRLMVMVFTIGLRGGEFKVSSTATYKNYVMTTITNDVVDIMAVSMPLHDHHTYTMTQCIKGEQNED